MDSCSPVQEGRQWRVCVEGEVCSEVRALETGSLEEAIKSTTHPWHRFFLFMTLILLTLPSLAPSLCFIFCPQHTL